MARIFGSLSRLLAATAGQGFAALALAAIASTAASAGSLNVAMVESFSGNSRGLQSMDYVQAGQVIRLNPQETIVLRYEASCVQEIITGGTVTVGIDRSQVLSGDVRRSGGPCDAPKMVLTSAPGEIAIAGRSFRGGPRR
jgi:hypothetical protein